MKKIEKKIIFYILITLASIIACLKCHEYAITMRFNNNAWGGELFLLLIPYVVYMAIKNFRDYRSTKWM